jgi:hopene-associated glycosyltransferase HpnB
MCNSLQAFCESIPFAMVYGYEGPAGGCMVVVLACCSVLVWTYLLCGRGAFWLAAERDDWPCAPVPPLPRVTAVIPARNEADGIAATIRSLLGQDYPGDWRIILVDDDSHDGTAVVATRAAAAAGQPERLQVITGQPLPSGWTGKLWAVRQGIAAAEAGPDRPDYLLLTDADIVYDPAVVTSLVAHARRRGLVLTSLMAKLRCESLAERAHIPAFIFFFQMLYPFAWVNRADDRTAGAAGGCMLVDADALRQAGGIDAVRGALIDDCSLARVMKARGPIWLALTDRVRSTRPYPETGEIRRMVSRSAYAQLGFSPLQLMTATLGMGLTYLAPPLLALFAQGGARWLGLLAWLMMAAAFQPILRFYRLSPAWGIALPGIALLYMLYTLDSAYQYARGRGGTWKGRVQANVSGQG